ncbi:hypothetical protein BAE44_0019501, partial [Dichanthelium oligosanthes]
QPGATFPYFEFKGFNKLSAPVCFGFGLELSSMVCVAFQPGATFPYFKFKGFKKLPAPVHFGFGLELSSMVCVA